MRGCIIRYFPPRQVPGPPPGMEMEMEPAAVVGEHAAE